MVKVSERESILCINTSVWCVDIVDDKRTTKAIDVLAPYVCMIPVSSWLVDYKLVDKLCSRLDRTLSNHSRTIRICSTRLEDTMEMDGCALVAKIVGHRDLDGVSHVCFDGRARELSVNADHRTREPIWRYSYPPYAPG